MSKLLIVVDVQNGFITEASSWLPSKLADYIKKADYDEVIATQYMNDTDTPCYRRLNWKGCMDKESQAICKELDGLYSQVVQKRTYSGVTTDIMEFLYEQEFDEIHVCGISESCCVLATAFDIFDWDFNIKVIPSLCAVTNTKSGYKEAVDFLLRENLPCLDI